MKQRKLPEVSQRVLKLSIKQSDVAYWESRVEPLIDQRYDGNRSAFIMVAVKDFVDRQPRVRKVQGHE